jgi:hypothetical protein
MISVQNNKTIIAFVLVAVVGLVMASSVLASNGQEKVEVCYKGKNTLSIGAPAVAAHLAHGDTVGACGSGDDGGGDVIPN